MLERFERFERFKRFTTACWNARVTVKKNNNI